MFINEAFANSVGTQRADLGKFKQFCLDITTLAVPNLIVNDLFLVVPMSSFTGYLTYMRYALGTPKGGAGGEKAADPFQNAMSVYRGDEWNANDVVNDPFKGFGQMTPERAAYTGQAVVETLAANKKLSWTPVLEAFDMDVLDSEGKPTAVVVQADGTVTDGVEGHRIKYVYDNQYIPQKALPTLVGRMSGIALTARARRIAVYYSQIAAFQAKTDYGMDFESQIAQQAQAELQYEIDSEAVYMLKEVTDALPVGSFVTWTDEELDTLAYSLKAEGFARKIEQAKAIVYKKTGRFMPNWMLVGPEVMPILAFVKGFEATSAAIANGPYMAGTVAGMKVFVTPMLGKECILGILGADGKTATGVYAPYMPIVPTQLLGFADGTMSQGFSTLYDMKILNADLVTKIVIVEGNDAASVEIFGESSETSEEV